MYYEITRLKILKRLRKIKIENKFYDLRLEYYKDWVLLFSHRILDKDEDVERSFTEFSKDELINILYYDNLKMNKTFEFTQIAYISGSLELIFNDLDDAFYFYKYVRWERKRDWYLYSFLNNNIKSLYHKYIKCKTI